jgi:curved DNA-binding protein CbpA
MPFVADVQVEPPEATRERLEGELNRVEAANAFAVLRTDSGSGAKEIRRAYVMAAKRYHPHRFARYDRGITRMATEIFIRINSAYKTLAAIDHVAEEPPDIQLPPVEEPKEPAPAARIGRGTPSPKRPLRAVGTQADRALEARERAKETFDESLRRYDVGDFTRSFEQLRELAIAHPHEKPYRAHMHCARAGIHFEAGEDDMGRKELERALRIDPELARAKKAMAAADKNRKKRGMFSRLFKK